MSRHAAPVLPINDARAVLSINGTRCGFTDLRLPRRMHTVRCHTFTAADGHLR